MPKFKGGLEPHNSEGKMAGKTYRVIRNGVTALVGTTDGRQVRGFALGQELPSDVAQDQIDHLLDVGLIALDGDEADVAISEQIVGPTPGSAPVSGGSNPATVDGSVSQPAASAAKPEWVAYAVAQGMSEDDADAATKADLVEKYGA